MSSIMERLVDDEIERLEGMISELRTVKAQMSPQAAPAPRARRTPRTARAPRIPVAERFAQVEALLQERGEMDTNQLADALGINRTYTRKLLGDMIASRRIKETNPKRSPREASKFGLR